MTRTGRPRSFDSERVIEEARDLFWHNGYAGTSLRDLKDGLGILPGSLYGAFGDKHRLFLRALDRYADGTREVAHSLDDPGPVVPRLRQLLLDVLDAAAFAPGRGCMLGNTAAEILPADAEAQLIVRHAFDGLEVAIERALVVARQAGETRPDLDCGAQARLIVVLLQGLHIVARAEADPRRLADAVDVAIAALR